MDKSNKVKDEEEVSEEHHEIHIYLYDLSQGMARQFAPMILGQPLDGIWHTGVVVYGYEYFYGGGIVHSKPGKNQAGTPYKIIKMGKTFITQDVFHSFLDGIKGRFSQEKYSLLEHNCNNFTDACTQFLIGQPIPRYITGLPGDVLKTPLGGMIKGLISQAENRMKMAVPGGNYVGGLYLPRRVDKNPDPRSLMPYGGVHHYEVEDKKSNFLNEPKKDNQQPEKVEKVVEKKEEYDREYVQTTDRNGKTYIRAILKVGKADILGDMKLSEADTSLLNKIQNSMLNKKKEFTKCPDSETAKQIVAMTGKYMQWPSDRRWLFLALMTVVSIDPQITALFEEEDVIAIGSLISNDEDSHKAFKHKALFGYTAFVCNLTGSSSDTVSALGVNEDFLDMLSELYTTNSEKKDMVIRLAIARIFYNLTLKYARMIGKGKIEGEDITTDMLFPLVTALLEFSQTEQQSVVSYRLHEAILNCIDAEDKSDKLEQVAQYVNTLGMTADVTDIVTKPSKKLLSICKQISEVLSKAAVEESEEENEEAHLDLD